ncbi:Ent1, partial [Caligus rogercresseyi]
VNTDSWQKGFLAITLITIVTLNLAMSLLQGGMGGLAAGFPSEYMNAMTQGQAIGGVILVW